MKPKSSLAQNPRSEQEDAAKAPERHEDAAEDETRPMTPAKHSRTHRRIPSAVVRELCGGVSDMSLWRWLQDERLNFPRPIVIARRRYWREAEILNWLESREVG